MMQMMKTNNSREIAFECLQKVFKHKAFSNILLNEISKKDIPQKFKNLVFAIVHGTIINKILLEKTVSKLIDNKKTNLDIQILLWMSAYQIRFLKTIPLYAVVNEAVSIAKKINPRLSGLVNATLKKVINNEQELFSFNELSEEQRVIIENSLPESFYNLFKEQYGSKIAMKLAKDSTKKPSIYFRVNTLKISFEDFFQTYKQELSLIKTFTKDCLITKVPIVQSRMYAEGLITVQDAASINVVNILDPKLNDHVLDMCAAPGGKVTHISSKLKNTGKVIACEINESKIKLIQQNIDRLGCSNIELICKDATSMKFEEKFDCILLDAPCSGFGVFKRKPEIKLKGYTKNKINEIIQLQSNLLDNAYQNLKVSGEMVYSTCTINKLENQNQIEKFLSRYSNMKKIYEEQLFGYENNTDGFYVCKMIKE
ncbi:16S rRNA (cytosine(967)-C(5))-methyltransferase [Entomoplasma ellychniae]|uniref:16S rRNA (cytosine(967)-C(5))-methyltransferase n=2 Tax=Entomoplasma ellychniae TaxID=2114 RepID=A0A8E2R026_9MOLU|nr:16S rRNA (cytosine(967)-C(5))-methyltransferase [Entomoplasma ellychniae]